MLKLMAFTRESGESIQELLTRFDIVREEAETESNFNLMLNFLHVSFAWHSRFLNAGSEICTQNPNETYSRATLFDFWCWGVGFHGQIPLCAFATTHTSRFLRRTPGISQPFPSSACCTRNLLACSGIWSGSACRNRRSKKKSVPKKLAALLALVTRRPENLERSRTAREGGERRSA